MKAEDAPYAYDTSTARGRVLWALDKLFNSNQREMARVIGVSQATISRVVHDVREPSKMILWRLGTDPRINATWASTGDGDPLVSDKPPPGTLRVRATRTVGSSDGECHVVVLKGTPGKVGAGGVASFPKIRYGEDRATDDIQVGVVWDVVVLNPGESPVFSYGWEWDAFPAEYLEYVCHAE